MGCATSRPAPRRLPNHGHYDISSYDAYYGNFPSQGRSHSRSRSRSYRLHNNWPSSSSRRYDVSPPRSHVEHPRRHASQYSRQDVSPLGSSRYEQSYHRNVTHSNFRFGRVGTREYY